MPTLSAALRRPELYGISGRKNHGKDTFARLVSEAAHENPKVSEFTITHFAATLKHVAGRVFNLSHEQMHDPALKEVPFETPIRMDVCLDLLRSETGLDLTPAGVTAVSPREVLQFLGTDYVRKVDSDYWIRRVLHEVRDTRRVLVPDTRFLNEAEAIRAKGGKIIKIVRIDVEVGEGGHASETSIDAIEPDLLLGVKTGDLSLPKKVAQLISLNKFEGATRYDYRRVQRAIDAYVGGMSKSDVMGQILGAQNAYPLDNILDYYNVPTRRRQSGKRVAHRTVGGGLHKLCGECREWKVLSDFNSSSKAWDGLNGWCRLCSAESHRHRYEKYEKTGSLVNIFRNVKRFAPARGLEFNLELADVEALWTSQDGRCWYSGVEMSTKVGSPVKMTLDRLDSSLGYTRENVVLCTVTTNLMKKDMSVSIFMDWVKRVHDYAGRRGSC